MRDIIIIGMGMSGITAGIYAKRAGLDVLMIDKGAPGGILQKINTITNYPGYSEITGPELAMNLFNQVKSLKIDYKNEEVIDVDFNNKIKKVITNKSVYEAKNVIIATGRVPKYLGLDNEKDYLGKGLSTCATCDGFLFKNEDVAVVGSGNSALSEALYLSKIVKKVYLLHRKKDFSGDKYLCDEINKTDNIEVIGEVFVKQINEKDNKIDSVLLSNDQVIKVKGVFIYVGYKPDTEIFNKYKFVNENGEILVNGSCKTSIDNIYAVGDCIKKDLYQLVTAANDGAIAVNDINKTSNN